MGVLVEGAVDDVGESAFEEAEGFSLGGSVLETLGDEGLSVGVDAELGDGNAMQRGAGLPVASSVESEPIRVG